MRSPVELSKLSVWRIKHLGAVRTSATSDRAVAPTVSVDLRFRNGHRIGTILRQSHDYREKRKETRLTRDLTFFLD